MAVAEVVAVVQVGLPVGVALLTSLSRFLFASHAFFSPPPAQAETAEILGVS